MVKEHAKASERRGRRLASLGVAMLLCSAALLEGQERTASGGQDRSGGSYRSRRAMADTDSLLGGVPTGTASDEVLRLSQADVVRMGLEQNLAVILGAEELREAAGRRSVARSRLLPQLRAEASERSLQFNLEATGFRDFPGLDKAVVGPFDVFDARVFFSLPLFDRSAMQDLKAASASLEAQQFTYQAWRDLVILAVSSFYIRTVANRSRVEAAEAQVRTAESLDELARSRNRSGLVPGIEVLRAQVQLQSERQRLIAARNELAKARLRLARSIGLPIGQRFELTDELRYIPLPEIGREEALAYAYGHRTDYRSAQARVEEGEAVRAALTGERWPDLRVDADYGTIGAGPATARETFGIGAELRLPIYQGGRIGGRVQEAEAELRQREAELEDLRAQIYYQLENAFLDVEASDEGVQVADRAVELASEQLVQARHRFEAGVADNLEVIQAQEATARSHDDFITRLLDHRLAKGRLAIALGLGEEYLLDYVMGQAFDGLPEDRE